MPFWNRGGDSSPPAEQSFSDGSASGDFAEVGGGGGMMAGAPGGAGSEMQQFSMALRQQMMVQTVINTLTDQAFERCITGKPGESLGGKEAACVHATVNKWLDSNEFMMGRLAKKQQAQSGSFS